MRAAHSPVSAEYHLQAAGVFSSQLVLARSSSQKKDSGSIVFHSVEGFQGCGSIVFHSVEGFQGSGSIVFHSVERFQGSGSIVPHHTRVQD